MNANLMETQMLIHYFRDLKKYIYGVETGHESDSDDEEADPESSEFNNFGHIIESDISSKEKHILGNLYHLFCLEERRSSELERLEAENKIVEKGLDFSTEDSPYDLNGITLGTNGRFDALTKENENLRQQLIERNLEIQYLKDEYE